MCDVYLYRRYHRYFPAVATAVVALAFITWHGTVPMHGTPSSGWNVVSSYCLLLSIMLCVMPKTAFCPLSLIPRYGTRIGLVAAAATVAMIFYGLTLGFTQIRVRQVEVASPEVPQAFDGYRIAQISDWHLGTHVGPYSRLVAESVDTVLAQKPDMVCFAGDLINFSHKELNDYEPALRRLAAVPDGVLTVFGNHDYGTYLGLDTASTQREEAALRSHIGRVGWHVLSNTDTIIRRGADSIVIAGEEYWSPDGTQPFVKRGNMRQAIPPQAGFVVAMSHDPKAWPEHVVAAGKPQLTLSGHTHGGQFALFGLSPIDLIYKHPGGVYREQGLVHSVTTGIGGNFPFRVGVPREVVVITLRHTS